MAARSKPQVRDRIKEARLSCDCRLHQRGQSRRMPLSVSPLKPLRVLFVDDEQSLQEFMRTELPRLGHEVTACPDGNSGLKAVARANYDAAILDIRMPGMNGIELLTQLKAVSPNTG